ncbi:MAG: HK97 family phage prohead protease [Bacteroidales bacterium]|nr:HK97 family phage prohead protease [Bacteroidales bacterium]
MARQQTQPQPPARMRYARLDYQVRASADADNEAERRVTGTASTATRDSYRERIHPASLERAIPEFMRNPAMLWQHDPKQPIGMWENVRRDGEAIVADGWVMPEEDKDDLADFAWKRIKRGVVRGLSIGFNADYYKDGAKDKDGVFWWGKPDGTGDLELKEISIVTLPANPDAVDLTVLRFDTSRPWEAMTQQCRAWGNLSAADIERALMLALGGSSDEVTLWVRELYEDYAIVSDWREEKTYRVEFAVVDGDVVVGERTEVSQLWVPVAVQQAASPQQSRKTIPSNLPLADEGLAWDGDAAETRVREWAGGDWAKYRKAFLWYDAEDAENYGAYKLPVGDIVDDELHAVWRGVAAAAAAMAGARGGVDIPDEDRTAVIATLKAYYKAFDKPWPENLSAETQQYKDVRWQADEPAIFEEQTLLRDVHTILTVKGRVEAVLSLSRHWAKSGRDLPAAALDGISNTYNAIGEMVDELCNQRLNAGTAQTVEDLLRGAFAEAYLGKEQREH